MSVLQGKVAVVTGAGRGIGRAIALRFAAEGAEVVCVSRSADNAEKTASDILKAVERVDILVNNAGVTRDTLLMRMSEEDWDTVINTNLRGAFHFIRGLSRQFIRQRSGRIINIASVIGLIGNAGQCNYAASKAGLIGLTKSVARELASRSITCNAIAPGFITTDMTSVLGEEVRADLLKRIPLNCLGEPEDIAHAALFLASPGARYITGQVLVVDGGMVM
jgi:3-oxoacyl-[acyl-carrier protein] reductase